MHTTHNKAADIIAVCQRLILKSFVEKDQTQKYCLVGDSPNRNRVPRLSAYHFSRHHAIPSQNSVEGGVA